MTNLMPVLVTKLLQALTTHHSWHGLSRQPLLNGEDVGGTSRTGANESPKNFILLVKCSILLPGDHVLLHK